MELRQPPGDHPSPIMSDHDRLFSFLRSDQPHDIFHTLFDLVGTDPLGLFAEVVPPLIRRDRMKPIREPRQDRVPCAAVLWKAVQEQQAKIEALERNTAAGRELIEQLQKEIEGLKKMVNEKTTAGN